jgi:GDP-L-fucose synthase
MIVSPGSTYTIEEVVSTIVKIMKFEGAVYFDKSKPEGIMKKNSCNENFRKHFPSFKFTSLEDGLSSNIDFFIKNYASLRK